MEVVPGADHAGVVTVRVLFGSEPGRGREVRGVIDRALAAGRLDGPDGVASWRLLSSSAGAVISAQAEHAARLVRS